MFLSRIGLQRYASLIARKSSEKDVTVVIAHRPEDYVGLLGSAHIMRLRPISTVLNEIEGELCDRGFVTGDGRYCIEMIMVVDQDITLLLTNEAKSYRAIIIQGTVLNLFGHDTVRKMVKMAEGVSAGRT